MIAAQPKCVAVERGQERERKLFERCAIDVRGHGAKFLGVSVDGALTWDGADEMVLSIRHTHINQIAGGLFHSIYFLVTENKRRLRKFSIVHVIRTNGAQ